MSLKDTKRIWENIMESTIPGTKIKVKYAVASTAMITGISGLNIDDAAQARGELGPEPDYLQVFASGAVALAAIGTGKREDSHNLTKGNMKEAAEAGAEKLNKKVSTYNATKEFTGENVGRYDKDGNRQEVDFTVQVGNGNGGFDIIYQSLVNKKQNS